VRAATGVLLVGAGAAFALSWAAPGIPLSMGFFLLGAVLGVAAAMGWLVTRRRFYDWLQYVLAQLEPEGVSTLAEDDYEQARLSLEELLDLSQPLPPMSGFGMTPATALHVACTVIAQRPALVLELGSGVSTLVIAKALERAGGAGRLVSVDHLPNYLDETRALLRREGVEHLVDLRVAPLSPLRNGARQWYDLRAFEDLTDVDLLLVDGPPGRLGPLSRYPALPMLAKRLSPSATLLVDDVHRRDERQMLERWARRGGLRMVRLLRGGKGLAVLRLEPGEDAS
jgi:predicted O-methyltransferase YrrM